MHSICEENSEGAFRQTYFNNISFPTCLLLHAYRQCGGAGCGSSGKANNLDNTDCCINGVLNNQLDCSTSGEAPCVVNDDGESVAPPPS